MLFLSKILKDRALSIPDKEAIICGNKRISYSELDKLSDKLAAFFLLQGITAGDKVGIFTNKDIEEVIVIFAALKIGAVFVHINPQYKEAQLAHLLKDCNIKVLILDKFKASVYEKIRHDIKPIDLILKTTNEINQSNSDEIESLENIFAREFDSNLPKVKTDESELASIIYTSGSTGMPKGIMISHKIFEDATVQSAKILGNNEDDRLISVTPFSFDGALSQLFTSIYCGAVLIQQKSVFPKDIVRTLIDEKITGFHAMPSLWNLLLQRHSPFAKYEYPDLRYVSIIGEHFPSKSLNKLKEILNKTEFIMMYGTTEAFRSTYLPYEDFDRKSGSVGIPFPGVEIKIVNEKNENCQPGEIGEIVHTGLFISSGYWNKKEETNKVFKNNSVYTGDLGHLDEDGYLYYDSRKDNMIKSSGFRVSPDEIEKCLFNCNGVSEVYVGSISDDESGTQIKAVIVLDDKNNSIGEKEIINYCRINLPFYMVPRIIEFRESLPKTASGKINKSELSKK